MLGNDKPQITPLKKQTKLTKEGVSYSSRRLRYKSNEKNSEGVQDTNVTIQSKIILKAR